MGRHKNIFAKNYVLLCFSFIVFKKNPNYWLFNITIITFLNYIKIKNPSNLHFDMDNYLVPIHIQDKIHFPQPFCLTANKVSKWGYNNSAIASVNKQKIYIYLKVFYYKNVHIFLVKIHDKFYVHRSVH